MTSPSPSRDNTDWQTSPLKAVPKIWHLRKRIAFVKQQKKFQADTSAASLAQAQDGPDKPNRRTTRHGNV